MSEDKQPNDTTQTATSEGDAPVQDAESIGGESDLVRSAGSGTSLAPNEAEGPLESGNDPTDTRTWVRRRIPVVDHGGLQEAIEELLRLPGVARAGVPEGTGEIVVDMQPEVLADQELLAVFDRNDVSIGEWRDEPLSRS